MVSAALYTAVDTVTLSKLPDEDQENILLMADVFHRILCQVIDTLDPYGEKFHQYKHLFTIDYLERHWKDMRSEISKILEEFRDDPDDGQDPPTPAEPPSAKFKAAAQPPKRAGSPRKEAPARRHPRRCPRGNQGIKPPRHHRRPREKELG